MSPSIANALLVEDGPEGSALEQQPEHTRNKVIHTTVSDSMSRRGNTRLASQYQSKNQQMHNSNNDHQQLFQANGAQADPTGKSGRSLGLQSHKAQKHN